MSDNSKIEWTDASWPVTAGCDHISPGCDNCYAARLASGRLSHLPAYAGLAERGRFNGTVRCLPERLDWPSKWRKPRRIFVCSMSDLFHQAVPDEFIAKTFAAMASAPRHTFQVLTKRHDRMRSLVGSDEFRKSVQRHIPHAPGSAYVRRHSKEWPLPNVWLGVSAEDQHWAEIRVHALLRTPAAVRWVSAEPLLGPIDLRNLKARNGALVDALCGDVKSPDGEIYAACPGSVSWVVTGGESGPGARPMHPDWARSLRDQCRAARVPYLFKQWGAWGPTGAIGIGGHDPNRGFVGKPVNEHGAREEIARMSKKAAGRELDGRTWDEFPRVTEMAGGA